MKQVVSKTLLLALVAVLMAAFTQVGFAQVYKTVDEDGNVTYSDRPLGDESEAVKLAPISVIESPTYEELPAAPQTGKEGEGPKEVPLKELRRNYADFAIVSPQQEESLWHPEESVTVAWNAHYQLQPGMQAMIYIDGKLHSKTTTQLIRVQALERGEHIVTATLVDKRNRKVATAEPVIFYIQRPNIYNNAIRVRPRG